MLLLKLLQQLFKTLNSEGTPGQVAAGMALGAVLGLTPLLNLHNLLIVGLAVILNVSMPGFMLGWALFVPFGFILDPLFDRMGQAMLLSVPPLTPVWTAWYNTPGIPYTNFNNTIVLGALVSWIVLAVPIYFLARWAVTRYRSTWGARVEQSRFYRAVTASKAYNVYRWFRPE